MLTPRRYAPAGGSFAPVRLAGFKWNGWQASAVYASRSQTSVYGTSTLIGYAPVSNADCCESLDLNRALQPRHWGYSGMAA